jgi:purine-binding chemotaxis protein CheW
MTAARYLAFHVDGVEYALEAVRVREIVPLPPVTRVPNAPAHVRGVANLRGRILPVVDLRVRLGSRPAADHRYVSVIVVHLSDGVAGLIVDGVADMLDVQPHQVRSPAGGSDDTDAGLVHAVADLGDRSPLLLDPDRVAGAVSDALRVHVPPVP